MKSSIGKFIKYYAIKAGKNIKSNSPTILAITSVVGLTGTVVLAVKATPKALMDYEDAKFYKEKKGEPFTKADAFKATWKHYIPTAIAGVSTATCIIWGNAISAKRIEGLKAALSMSEAALLAYKDEIAAELGAKKADALANTVEQHIADANPPKNEKDICKPEKALANGSLKLIRDTVTGEYFWANPDKLDTAIEKANTLMTERSKFGEDSANISYNDLVELINDAVGTTQRASTEAGDILGFNLTKTGKIERMRNASWVCPEDSLYPGEVAILLRYRHGPISDFDELPFH